METRAGKTRPKGWVLLNAASAEGRAKCRSFPLAIFEKVVLGELQEIDRSILGTESGPDEVLTLAGEYAKRKCAPFALRCVGTCQVVSWRLESACDKLRKWLGERER